MDRVVIGVDPHKLSVTIEARDDREILRAVGQFATDGGSYRQLLEVARALPYLQVADLRSDPGRDLLCR